MHDSRNDSINSNDGRDIKHVQGSPQKKNGQKSLVMTNIKENRSTNEKKRQPLWTMRGTKLDQTTCRSRKNVQL